MSEEEIAAAFFVVPAVVKQRLRLMTVSDKLLEIYEQDGMKLDQLMAFSISDDHTRQEQVWEIVSQSHNREPYLIRRMLTEKTVRASDRRVRFVGLDAYVAAGGPVMRDLFEADDGGWLQDPTLLDQLVMEKLQEAAEQVRAEGWKWVETALSFPWGHTRDFAEIDGTPVALSEEEAARLTALHSEQETIEAEYAQADEFPEDVDIRLGEIEQAIEALEERPVSFDPADMVRAGAFVSLDTDGTLLVERGFVLPEDLPAEPDDGHDESEGYDDAPAHHCTGDDVEEIGTEDTFDTEPEEDGLKPLSDRLLTELTAWRTLALLAHCLSFGINALHESSHGPSLARSVRERLARADRLATALALDLVEAGWQPTVENYLGRVTKARILEAVREARGTEAAGRIAHLKKNDMAQAAERLIEGTGWLPEALRTKGLSAQMKTDEVPDYSADGPAAVAAE